MATRPTVGGSDGTWGTELNAHLDISLDTDGKVDDGAAQTTSAAPTADAELANKKYVDDFHVYAKMNNSATQAIGSSSTTKVQYNTSEFDSTGSIVDLSNERLTPGVVGYYIVTGVLQLIDLDDAKKFDLTIKKNNAVAAFSSLTASIANADPCISLSTLLYLDADDYVEVWAYQTSGGTVGTGNHDPIVYFQGWRLII